MSELRGNSVQYKHFARSYHAHFPESQNPGITATQMSRSIIFIFSAPPYVTPP